MLLDADGALVVDPCRAQPEDLPALLDTWRPDVVAIDAPCSWGGTGARSRPAERQLARLGIRSYCTPAVEWSASPFYDWVRTGLRAYAAVTFAGYRLHDGNAWCAPTVCEAFPHGATVAVLGGVPRSQPASEKRRARQTALRAVGIDDGRLRTIDQIDAALAAFIGLELRAGTAASVGDTDTGFVVLPGPVPPERYVRLDQNAGGA